MAEKKAAKKPAGEAELLLKIAEFTEPFQSMGGRLHALIRRSAPSLQPGLWYGMPTYSIDGKTICFFRSDKKYMTFGITQDANLAVEEGAPDQLMESAWYFTALDDPTEARLSAIVRKLAG